MEQPRGASPPRMRFGGSAQKPLVAIINCCPYCRPRVSGCGLLQANSIWIASCMLGASLWVSEVLVPTCSLQKHKTHPSGVTCLESLGGRRAGTGPPFSVFRGHCQHEGPGASEAPVATWDAHAMHLVCIEGGVHG